MAHVRIAIYKFQPGRVDEVIGRAATEAMTIFRRQQGFVAYEGVRASDDTAVSISVWETRENADEAAKVAASWMKENVAPLVVSADVYIGELAFSSRST